eukprot:GHUV01032723.1.p1 GENE.GHUV01032723.1~~GHUV01032723.1.p1  ORF type:complete len:101 (-),score=3.78 GHUV01032723.1:86-388(-)
MPLAPVAASSAAADAGQQNIAKLAWRKLVRELSSLPRAIGIMAVVTGLSALGTIIPQNKVWRKANLIKQARPTLCHLCRVRMPTFGPVHCSAATDWQLGA